MTKMPLIGKAYDFLSHLNLVEALRPMLNKLTSYLIGEAIPTLGEIDNMQSPRVLKSHLPFYLLNPKLLDTCKVIAFSLPLFTK